MLICRDLCYMYSYLCFNAINCIIVSIGSIEYFTVIEIKLSKVLFYTVTQFITHKSNQNVVYLVL